MIPLSIPFIDGNEWKYVKECLDTGWVSSAGKYVSEFENVVSEYAGAAHGVAVVNGTSGLHLALHLLGIGKGDSVIVPNITFIASANSILYTNAEPIFVDVDPHTWQMDLDLVEETLSKYKDSKSIKAIMPVHVLGNMCDMDRLQKIANSYNIKIIEDSSESLGSSLNGKHSGTFGDIGVFSFNGNKIISTGGGGVIVTNDGEIAKRAKHLSTQSKVNPKTYFHDEMGFNFRLVNVLAAIGVAQMEQLPLILKSKKNIDRIYREELNGIGDIQFQHINADVDPNCWLFTFSSSLQSKLLKELEENAIVARPFWFPMNQLPMFQNNLYIHSSDHSFNIHKYSLSIPSSAMLEEKDQYKVIDVIKSVFK